jgi:hypothetical protein
MNQLKIISTLLVCKLLFSGTLSFASVNCQADFLELDNSMRSIITASERSQLSHEDTFITEPDTGIRPLQFATIYLRNGRAVHGIYNGSHDGSLIIRSFELDEVLGANRAYALMSKEDISHIDVHAYGFEHYSDSQGMIGFREGERAVFRVGEDLGSLGGFSWKENIKVEGVIVEETERYIELKVNRASSIRGVDTFSEESSRNSEFVKNIGKYYLVHKDSEFHWIGDWSRIVEVNPLPRSIRERIRERVLPVQRAALRWWQQF